MTPAEIAALKRLTAWNTGDTDAIPEAYTHDALTFQQDLRRVLTLAEQALRLRELMIEDAVAECTLCGRHPEFPKKSDCRECAAAVNDRIRAALTQAQGDGE